MIYEILPLLISSLILNNCETQSNFLRKKSMKVRLRFNILMIQNNELEYLTKNKNGQKVYFDILTDFIDLVVNQNIESILDIEKISETFNNEINFIIKDINNEFIKKSERYTKRNRDIPDRIIKPKENALKIINLFNERWKKKKNLLFVVEDNYSQILDQQKSFNQIKNLDFYLERGLTINVYYNNPKEKHNMFVRKPIVNVGLISDNYDDIKDFLNLDFIKNKEMMVERENVFNEPYTNGTLKYYKEIWNEIFKKENIHKKNIYKENKISYNSKKNGRDWGKYTILELDNKIVFLHHLSYQNLYFYYQRNIYWSNLYYRESNIFSGLISIYNGKEYYKSNEILSLYKKINYSREYNHSYMYDLKGFNNINFKKFIDNGYINTYNKNEIFEEIKKSISIILVNDRLKLFKYSQEFLDIKQYLNAIFSTPYVTLNRYENLGKTFIEDINKIDQITEKNIEDNIKKIYKNISEKKEYDHSLLIVLTMNYKKKILQNICYAFEKNIVMVEKKKFKNLDNLFKGNTQYNIELSRIKTVYNPKNIQKLFSKIKQIKITSSQFDKMKRISGSILNIYDYRFFPNKLNKDELLLDCYLNQGLLDIKKKYKIVNIDLEEQTLKIKKMFNIFGEDVSKNIIDSSFNNKKVGLVINRKYLSIFNKNISLLENKQKINSKKKYCVITGNLFFNDFDNNNGINLNNLELFNKSNLFQIDYTKTQWKSGNLFFCGKKCSQPVNNMNTLDFFDDFSPPPLLEITRELHLFYNGAYYKITRIEIKEVIIYNPKIDSSQKLNATFLDKPELKKNVVFKCQLDLLEEPLPILPEILPNIRICYTQKSNAWAAIRSENQNSSGNSKFYEKETFGLIKITQQTFYDEQEFKKNNPNNFELFNIYRKDKNDGVKNNIIFDRKVEKEDKEGAEKLKSIISKNHLYLPISLNDYYFSFYTSQNSPIKDLLSNITETFTSGYDFFKAEKRSKIILKSGCREEQKNTDLQLFRLGSEYGNYGNFFTYRKIDTKERIKKISNIAIRDFWIIPNQSFSYSDLDSKKNIKLILPNSICKNRKSSCSDISKNLMTFFMGMAGNQGGIYSGGEQQIIKLTQQNRKDSNGCFYPAGKENPWSKWTFENLNKNVCNSKKIVIKNSYQILFDFFDVNKNNELSFNEISNFINSLWQYRDEDNQNSRNRSRAKYRTEKIYKFLKKPLDDPISFEEFKIFFNKGKNLFPISELIQKEKLVFDNGDFDNRLKNDTFKTLKKPDYHYKSGLGFKIKLPNGNIIEIDEYKIKGQDIYILGRIEWKKLGFTVGTYAGLTSFENGNKCYLVNINYGEMKNFIPHGKGSKTYRDGSIYQGYWINGKKYGKGSYYFPRNIWSNKPILKMDGYWNQIKKENGEWKFIGNDFKEDNKLRWYNL